MIYGLDKLNGCHPALWVAAGYIGLHSHWDWKITSGVRTTAETAELYAQGRTIPGVIVTDAGPGTTPHEFGCAIDMYPTLDKGKSIVLSNQHPAFDEKAALVAKIPGVREITISTGKDFPHIEVTNWYAQKNWKSDFAGFAALAMVAGAIALVLR